MMKSKILKNENELNLFIENIKLKNSLNYIHIHNLLDVSIHKNSGLCSINYVIKLFYEYYSKNLQDEIDEKLIENQSFNFIELTHILYKLGLTNYYLEQNNLFSCNIRPESIFYDKENSILKLINRLEDKEYYYDKIEMVHRRNLISNNNVYISPKLFNQIKRPVKNFIYDKNKEDVFAIGLIILTLGLQEDSKKLYDYTKGEFDKETLEFWLEKFKENFSIDNLLLVSTIENMLNLDEEERPNFELIFTSIPEYEKVIENFNNYMKNESEIINNVEEEIDPVKELSHNDIENPEFQKENHADLHANNEENYQNGKLESEANMSEKKSHQMNVKIENDFPPLPEGEDIEMNGINYLWDEEYKRHYYFDSKIDDYEWYYDNEELEQLKKSQI